jgi:hypothetical protein
MTTELQKSFHAAMIEVYVRAKSEAGYTASRFLTMVTDQGGYQAARTLLHAATVSEDTQRYGNESDLT